LEFLDEMKNQNLKNLVRLKEDPNYGQAFAQEKVKQKKVTAGWAM
jgi:hypothetical protein